MREVSTTTGATLLRLRCVPSALAKLPTDYTAAPAQADGDRRRLREEEAEEEEAELADDQRRGS